jgi:hypothetical protein
MAKAPEFGVKATDLGKSNFQGYVQQGIVDKSKAMNIAADYQAISDLGTLAINSVKEYDKYQTLKGVAESVGDVIREQEERSLDGQAKLAQDLDAQRQELNQVKNKVGYDDTYPSMLNQEYTDASQGIQNTLAEKTDKLTKAREQGIMTDFEMKERLAKITREAIAANPAYASEISAHVGNVAELNNLTARVKKDVDAVKAASDSQAAALKQLRTKAMENNINVFHPDFQTPDGDFDYQAISDELTRRMNANQLNKGLKQSVENNEAIGKINAQEWIDQGLHYQLADAQILDIDAKLKQIADDPKLNATAKKAAIANIISNASRDIRRGYSINGVGTEKPEIKDSITHLENQSKLLQKVYEDHFMGVTDKAQFENQVAALTAKTKLDRYERMPNLLEAEIAMEAFKDYDFNVRDGYKIQRQLEGNVLNAMTTTQGSFSDPENNNKNSRLFKSEPGLKGSPMEVTINSGINMYNNSGRGLEVIEKNINKTLMYINNGVSEGNVNAIQTLTKIAGKPENYMLMPKLTDNVKMGMKTAFMEYRVPLDNNLKMFREAYKDADLKIRPEDGTMVIDNYKIKEHGDFASKGLRSINETFKAYHAVSGNSSIQQSISEFYEPFNVGVPSSQK